MILAAGCSKKKQDHQNIIINRYINQQNDITLAVSKLAPNNLNTFTKKKIFKEYQPLEIYIDNKSKYTYILNKYKVGLPLTSPSIIARSLHKKAWLAYMWPLAIINPLTAHILAMSLIIAKNIPQLSWLFLTLGIASIETFINKENEKCSYKFLTYSTNLDKILSLAPHSSISKIVYVKQEFFKERFYIALENIETEDIIRFYVSL